MVRVTRPAALIFLALMGACGRGPAVGPYKPGPPVIGTRCPHGDDPAADARRHIEERRPHLLGFGTPLRRACVRLDVGLPFESLGCLVGDRRYADAYNAVVFEELRSGKLEEFRVKAREMSLEEVLALFSRGGGIQLEKGSRPVLAPGGRFKLVIEPSPSSREAYPWPWVVDRRSGQRRQLSLFGLLPAVVAFEPEGLAIVRREDHEFTSWDLGTGLAFAEYDDRYR